MCSAAFTAMFVTGGRSATARRAGRNTLPSRRLRGRRPALVPQDPA
jgi:hypothetical protein